MNENMIYKRLTEVLKLISADFNTQKRSLPDFVHVPDEIALNFDEIYIFVNSLYDKKFIDIEHLNKLKEINSNFNKMDSNKKLWNLNSLKTSSEWQDLRETASKLLYSLKVQQTSPDLFWINYKKVQDS
ncbi:MAG: hypothetical protein ISR65_18735 [Bacteriovoracaceae bacterium]|nr:hypothetical protein [Bacteriovoracaceae bacterium]